jgi:iron complex outermembrane receptor protein
MHHKPPTRWIISMLLIAAWFSLGSFSPSSFAQSSSTGTIVGRVFNPATSVYLRNAEVRLQGTDRLVTTENDGSFTLANVPAGPAALAVSYTGYNTATVNLNVTAGAIATANVNLTSSLDAGDTTVKLDKFVVTTEREGNAKAIMDQKQSMNVSNIVAAETFGNIAEGNIGEFVKNLPGIQMDYVEADARSPRIRGLPAQYTSVTFDGMKLASADAFIQNNGTDNGGGAGTGDRSFGFEQVTMSNIDSVEVNFTTNASQDADSPAGNINLKSKHAYERSGRLITVDASLMANSEQLYLHKTVGPDDRSEYKVQPNAHVNYSDSFFDHRLGVIVDVNESNSYNEQRQFAPTYDTTTTATDTRPLVLNKLLYKNGPKFSERSALGVTFDFKATDKLSLSLIANLNNYAMFAANHTFAVASTRANITGDGLSAWTNVPITAVTSTMQDLKKRTHGYSYLPSFEYKWRNLLLTGAASVTKSTNNYGGGASKSLPGNVVSNPALPLTGLTVSASHPADDNYAWTIRQTGGADWANLANYKLATAYPQFSYDGRYNSSLIYQAKLDAKYTTDWALPTWFKAGAKVTETTWDYKNPTAWQVYNFTGPGGGLGGTWANYPSAYAFDPGHGASMLSISGGTPAVQDHNTIGYLFASNPELFVPAGTAANFLTAYVQQPKWVKEQGDAAYAMANSRPMKNLEFQAGLRWERVRDEIKDFNPLGSAKVIAAGYPVTATTTTTATAGIASTIPGMIYQYFTNPKVARTRSSDSLYPSASGKYWITPDLQVLAGYSYTVTLPSYGDISGTYSENDATSTISAPNPNLKAQYANNYTIRLTDYFANVSSVSVGVFENDFKNFTQTQNLPAGSAADFGYTDPVYSSYTVTTKVNMPGTVRYRGMTFEYAAPLTFLPDPFKGFSASLNYTRTYTSVQLPDPSLLNAATPYNYGWMPGVAPNVFNYGLNYRPRKGRFSIGANARWTDRSPTTSIYNTWQKQNTKVDVNASFRLTERYSLTFYGRNIFNVPDYVYANNNPQQIGTGRAIEYYGAYYYAGVRARF